MLAASKQYKKAAVIGGGLLGIPECRDALFVCARNRKDKRDRACRQDEFIVRLDSVKSAARRYRHSRHYVKRLELVQRKQHPAVYR
jgi:hypothetical protein